MSANELKILRLSNANPYRATRDGKEFEGLFPAPDWREQKVPRSKTVEQTVHTMRKVIKDYAWQTKSSSDVLKGDNLYQTCKNIWKFLYDHFKYQQDDEGQEQLRTPALSWHIRTSRGIDCDDFSIFAGTILYNLGIPFYLRIAKYPDPLKAPEPFSHVYVVVPQTSKRYVVIDAVLENFDAEKTPMKEYKDFLVMENSNLSGIDVSILSGTDSADEQAVTELIEGAWFPERDDLNGTGSDELDAMYTHLLETRRLVAANPGLIKNNEDPDSFLKMLDYAIRYWHTDKRDEALAILEEKEQEINALNGFAEQPEDFEEFSLYYGLEGLDGITVLGRVRRVRKFFSNVKKAVTNVAQSVKTGVTNVAKKVFKAVIKTSPLTVSARAGMLLALKLNIGKMAERLKWGYLTEAEAQKRGFDMTEWRKLRDRLVKSEKLYADTMQGSARNFKNAILTGRAGRLSGIAEDEEELLGADPVTSSATMIATALPFIKKIVNLLKDVDVKRLVAKVKPALLQKAKKEAEAANPIPPDVKAALPDNEVTAETKIDAKTEETRIPAPTQTATPDPATTSNTSTNTPAPTPEKENFFTQAGNWIKENPGKSLLIAGGIALAVTVAVKRKTGLGIVTGKGKKKKGKNKKNPPKVVAGVPKKKSGGKKENKGGGRKTIHL